MIYLDSSRLSLVVGGACFQPSIKGGFEVVLEMHERVEYQGFTFVYDGCYFDGKLVDPLMNYCGFRIATNHNHNYYSVKFCLIPYDGVIQ